MKKYTNYTKGFTLIELLVVIAIIGILSAVVLVSLNTARKKGNDTRVISDVQQTRTSLESGNTGSSYPDLKQNAGTGAQTQVAGALLSTGSNNANLTSLASDASGQGGTISYIVTTSATDVTTAYAIYGRLVSDNTKYFCIDSTGKTNPSAGAATTVVCP